MCDTLCLVGRERTLFAKNSDRPIGECQLVEVHPPRSGGGEVRATHITIADDGAYALVGSRPVWCWGLEHGVNEHRVAIGNERVWTVDDPWTAPTALIGMDLVRLGLERARTADQALDVMTGLLESHGQGGECEADGEPYWSSFLVADPGGAWVLETSGRTWAARAVEDGAAISNRLTLGADWDRASRDVPPGASFDAWRDPDVPTAIGDRRLAVTRPVVATGAAAVEPDDLAATLRDHGGERWGAVGDSTPVVAPPSRIGTDLTGNTVCMHLRDFMATAAGMIVELPVDPQRDTRAWACLGSPCVGIFVPVFPPTVAPEILADPASWERFDRLRQRVEDAPEELSTVRSHLGPLEAELWAEGTDLDRESRGDFAAAVSSRIDAVLTTLEV